MIIPFVKNDNIARQQEREVYREIRKLRETTKNWFLKLIIRTFLAKKCLLGCKK